MPRIHPVKPETTDAKTAATLQAVKRKLGVLPNIFTTFAQSPAALNSYVQADTDIDFPLVMPQAAA
jgi:hypothetical protein